jgi:8-oxo-dGTP pyrophosphatase MutT (NUDIX family)
LLIQSSTLKHWISPKGNLEPGLSSSEPAYFEAFEEAGVLGTIGTRSIGSYKYRKKPEKGGELCRVKLYPLEGTQVLES